MRFIPTLLSLARALITPWVVIAVMHGRRQEALALCVAGGFSDFLDGYLARRFGWTSRIGAWMDAVADKVLLSSLFVAFGMAGWAPGWLVMLVIGRDLVILALAGAGLAFTPIRDFPPSVWGKVSTNVQILTAFVTLANPGSALSSLFSTMIVVCATTTAWSGLHYVVAGIARYRKFVRAPD
ncbi:MAG: CDP-alcohol phosphatidyltransferase family protein [Bryobacteraceae bacterium]